jgi:VanZ family protein
MAGLSSVPFMNQSRFFRYILPAMLWMAVIFTLSTHAGSATHTDSFLNTLLARFFPGLFHRMTWPELDAIHYYVRKAAHVIEYAILGILMVRALRGARPFTDLRLLLSARGICALYAATDEFHQIFVPGRTPKVTDVCIDACGSALGIVLLFLFMRRRRPDTQSALPLTPKETV